jgi:hypothetical protein
MDSLAIALILLGCAFAASVLGMRVRSSLPADLLDDASRDVVKLVMALVATMAALVLGLLVASANTAHDRQTERLREFSADIMLLDRTLALYGPDARAVRDGLRASARQTHDTVWSPDGVRPENLNSASVRFSVLAILRMAAALEPRTDAQRLLKARILDQADTVSRSRMQMFESRGGQIAWPFLAVLIFWVSILFLGYGLLAPFNATLAVTQLLGALSVAGALFMILELNEPYRGLLRISDAPLVSAIAELDQP